MYCGAYEGILRHTVAKYRLDVLYFSGGTLEYLAVPGANSIASADDASAANVEALSRLVIVVDVIDGM